MTVREQIEIQRVEIAELNATLAEVSEAIAKGGKALKSFWNAVDVFDENGNRIQKKGENDEPNDNDHPVDNMRPNSLGDSE